jgi:hypothetical protein
MKTNKTLLKELRAELHHWQMIARMDARSLKRTREKCKEIATKMRALQAHQTLDRREPRV